jgi:hypothetical protein
MMSFPSIRPLFRGFAAAVLAFATVATVSRSHAAPSPASVAAIESTSVADLILLRGGFDAGLRQGMVCRITRDGADVGEVLLVELRPSCSAALILNLAPGQSIRPGDSAAVKLLKS